MRYEERNTRIVSHSQFIMFMEGRTHFRFFLEKTRTVRQVPTAFLFLEVLSLQSPITSSFEGGKPIS